MLWRRRAEQDLTEAYLFLGADSPAAAERLVDAVEHAVQLLLEHPGAGHLRDFGSARSRGVRSWVVQGFQAYVILYRASGDDLEIVRVVHGARDLPGLLDPET